MLLRRSDPDDETEWADVVAFMNEQTGESYSRDFVRKSWPLLSMYIQAGWVGPPDDSGSYFESQRLEAEKERIRLRDERNELNRLKRDLARADTMVDLWKQIISESVEPFHGYQANSVCRDGDCDLIVHLTDLHAGLVIDNFCNRYNEEIMIHRLQEYLGRIEEIASRHLANNCYVLLGGDLISGAIHTPLRIESNMNTLEQLKFVSVAVSEFVKELSPMFSDVYVYSVAGNHSRLFQNKKENAKGENLDTLVPFYMQAKLSEYENVHIYDHNDEESVARFSVRGNLVYGVHGDKDTMESVVQKLTMFFGAKPDIVMAGHRHTNGFRTVYDSKVIESGCLSGPDNFCMDHRLQNKPEQMVLVVNDTGIECLYDVKFS